MFFLLCSLLPHKGIILKAFNPSTYMSFDVFFHLRHTLLTSVYTSFVKASLLLSFGDHVLFSCSCKFKIGMAAFSLLRMSWRNITKDYAYKVILIDRCFILWAIGSGRVMNSTECGRRCVKSIWLRDDRLFNSSLWPLMHIVNWPCFTIRCTCSPLWN